ncbi:MAG: terminase large subunit, partial [Phycisphaerae bacterium]
IDNLIPAQDILPSPAVKVIGGIDWGWNDPCSVIVIAECQDGKVYLVDEIYESHLPLDRLAERLNHLKSKWLISEFYCDSSRPEIMNQLRKAGLPCKIKNVASIEQGIALVDSRIRTEHLKCFDTLKNLITEMQQYQRKPDKDNRFGEKPVDKMNHLCDALRYGICGLDFGRQLTFVQPTESDKQQTELEAQIRIGQKPVDPEAQKAAEAAERKAAYAKRFYEMAFGDLED